MRRLVQAYHEAGLLAQLWWYPLAAEDDVGAWPSHAYGLASIVAEHPDTAFLVAFGDNVQAAAAADDAIRSGHRSALLVSTEDVPGYGDTVPVYFSEAFTRRGGEVVDVVDVRLDEQWRFSNRKIPGAVHENPAVPSTWMDKYPKDKTIVFY